MLAPSSPVLDYLGMSGAIPVCVYDRWSHAAERRLAARQPPAHRLQHDVACGSSCPAIAELYGPGRTVIIYTVAGVAGFLLSSTIGWFCRRDCRSWAPPTPSERRPRSSACSAPWSYYGRRSGSRHRLEPGLVVRASAWASTGLHPAGHGGQRRAHRRVSPAATWPGGCSTRSSPSASIISSLRRRVPAGVRRCHRAAHRRRHHRDRSR